MLAYVINILLPLFTVELIVGFDWSAKVNPRTRGHAKSPYTDFLLV